MFSVFIGCGNAYEERGTVALRSFGVIADAKLRRPYGVNRLQWRVVCELSLIAAHS